MTRQLSTLSMFVVFIGFAADSYAVSTFSQNFESDTLGSAAGWTAGTRNPNHFDVSGTPGTNRPTIGVINTDSVSPDQSIEVVGVANGNSMHTWRDYGGLSSNGVDPVTVSFDFNIVSLENPNYVEFHPFVFNTSLFGSVATPGPDGGVGWPVIIRVLNNGVVDYVAHTGPNVDLVAAGTYIQGEWARVTATLNGSQDVDLSITMLTGINAAQSGSITGGGFQVAGSYYANALDELRGIGFASISENSAGFFAHDSVRIDNFSVTIGIVPEPASGMMLGLGAIALLQVARRRRTN